MSKKSKVDEEKIDKFIEEFDREFGYTDDDDTPTAVEQSKPETTTEKIARLEKETANERTALAQNFSAEALEALQAKSAELADLQKRVKREDAIKERWRLRYVKSFMTPEEFERRWEAELRDKAIEEDANGVSVDDAMKHPIYNWR